MLILRNKRFRHKQTLLRSTRACCSFYAMKTDIEGHTAEKNAQSEKKKGKPIKWTITKRKKWYQLIEINKNERPYTRKTNFFALLAAVCENLSWVWETIYMEFWLEIYGQSHPFPNFLEIVLFLWKCSNGT